MTRRQKVKIKAECTVSMGSAADIWSAQSTETESGQSRHPRKSTKACKRLLQVGAGREKTVTIAKAKVA